MMKRISSDTKKLYLERLGIPYDEGCKKSSQVITFYNNGISESTPIPDSSDSTIRRAIAKDLGFEIYDRVTILKKDRIVLDSDQSVVFIQNEFK